MKQFLKLITALIKGGIFFLIPIILALVLIEKAIHLIQPLSLLLQKMLGLEASVLFTPYLLSLLLVITLCLAAGVLAQRGMGKKMLEWIEEHVLILFPGYKLMKTTFEEKAGLISDKNFPVVLVPIDGWMLAYLVEELENNQVLIFVPSAPETWNGSLVIFDQSKIKKTDLTQSEVNKIGRSLGIGSLASLKGKLPI